MSTDLETELRTAFTHAVRDVHLDPNIAATVRARVTRRRNRYRRSAAAASVAVVAAAGGIGLVGGKGYSDSAWAQAVESVPTTAPVPGPPITTISGVAVTYLPDGLKVFPQSIFPDDFGLGYGSVSQGFSPNVEMTREGASEDGSLSIGVYRGPKAELAHIRATEYMGPTTEATFAGQPALRSSSDGARHLMWQCGPKIVCSIGALGIPDEEVVAVAAGLQVGSEAS